MVCAHACFLHQGVALRGGGGGGVSRERERERDEGRERESLVSAASIPVVNIPRYSCSPGLMSGRNA